MKMFQTKPQPTERECFLAALAQAQKEYNVAMSHFSEAREPDRIDEAIYLMEAARKKYSYFLKRCRAQALEYPKLC